MFNRLLRRWRERGTPTDHPFHDVIPSGIDWRGLPSPECFCGSRTFVAVIWFDDAREVGGWVLEGMCTDCKALVTLPTPIDFDIMEACDE
jgi:hypothetical protein